MQYIKRSLLGSIVTLAIAGSICFPDNAFGAEKSNLEVFSTESEANFVLTGVHTDAFYLESNNNKIFDVEGCLPGDQIEAVIKAENLTDEKLDFALSSIDSLLLDTSLFDALTLSIKQGEKVLYDGAFHTEQLPVTEYITVEAGETILLDISVRIPKELDNAYQGTEMESVWIFEAKHPGAHSGNKVPTNENVQPSTSPDDIVNQSGVKTGVELPGCDSNYAVFKIIGIIFIALGLVFILVGKKKEN